MARSTLAQAVPWARMAPTTTSKAERAGHQPWGPNRLSSAAYRRKSRRRSGLPRGSVRARRPPPRAAVRRRPIGAAERSTGGRLMLQSLLSRHLMVLVMLILAGIGWLLEAKLNLFEWFYNLTRPYEAIALDGLVPGVLLVLLGAFLDTYRAHQESLRERERMRIMMEMAATVAHE